MSKWGSCGDAEVKLGSEGRGRHITLFHNERRQGALGSTMGVTEGSLLIRGSLPKAFAQLPRKEPALSQGREMLCLSP